MRVLGGLLTVFVLVELIFSLALASHVYAVPMPVKPGTPSFPGEPGQPDPLAMPEEPIIPDVPGFPPQPDYPPLPDNDDFSHELTLTPTPDPSAPAIGGESSSGGGGGSSSSSGGGGGSSSDGGEVLSLSETSSGKVDNLWIVGLGIIVTLAGWRISGLSLKRA